MNNYVPNDIVVSGSSTKLQTYLSHVYAWMAAGLLVTGLVAWYVSNNINLVMMAYKVRWVLFIAQLGLVFVLSGMVKNLSGSVATGLFMLYSALTGLTFSLLFLIYTGQSIANVFFITTGMFGALSIFGYVTKKDLSALGRFMFMGLIGIIIASVINIFLKSSALMWTTSVLGIIIFAGLTAYDTQKLKMIGEEIIHEDANTFRRFVILGALTLYLDFINMFIFLLQFFGDRR